MRYIILSFIISCALIVTGRAFAAQEYTIDPSHSSINFSIKHMMVSTTNGNFKTFTGSIAFDEKDLANSKAEAVIEAASINTENDKRDEHLRGPDFFDAVKFPQITFKTNSIEAKDGHYMLTGELTLKGVTKEVSFPVEINGPVKSPMGGEAIGLSGQLTINRQDYGVSFNNMMDNGGLMVGNDVKVNVEIEAHSAK